MGTHAIGVVLRQTIEATECHGMLLQAQSVLPGGCTKGELTRPGQLQSRDLGQWLRQRYVQKMAFLSPEYQASLYPVHTMSKPCNGHGMLEILRSDPLQCPYPSPWPACNTLDVQACQESSTWACNTQLRTLQTAGAGVGSGQTGAYAAAGI